VPGLELSARAERRSWTDTARCADLRRQRDPVARGGGTDGFRRRAATDGYAAARQAVERMPAHPARVRVRADDPSPPPTARRAIAHTKRLMKARAASATSRQPLSMVSACPRFARSFIPVRATFRFSRPLLA